MRQFVVTVCALLFAASLGSGLPSVERDRRCGGSNTVDTPEEAVETTSLGPGAVCESQGSNYSYCGSMNLCLFVGKDSYYAAKSSCLALSDKPLLGSLAIFPCIQSYSEEFWELGVEMHGMCGIMNPQTVLGDCNPERLYLCNVGFP